MEVGGKAQPDLSRGVSAFLDRSRTAVRPGPKEGNFDFEDLPFSPELRHLLESVEAQSLDHLQCSFVLSAGLFSSLWYARSFES